MLPDSHLERIEAWACEVPLAEPLSFGAFTVTHREYTAVRITTAGGLQSDCLGLSRRAPIDVALLDVIAPIVMGQDALAVSDRLHDIARATVAMDSDGVIGRARSLLEICLWDLCAQASGTPLWKYLGGTSRAVPVLLVEGYPIRGESDEGFAERLAARVSEGYRAIKIEAASYADPLQLARRLAAFRSIAGDDPELVVDLAWTWESAHDGAERSRTISDYHITWIEDPMPRHMTQEIARLRGRCATPIASGDEATRPADLHDLLEADAVDVLRLDATTIGGISAVLDLARRASALGKSASLHVHPEIHQHCAFAHPTFAHVEAFPTDRPFDSSHELLEVSFMSTVRDGLATPPSSPGTGIALNLDAVWRSAYRNGALDATAR